MATKNTLAKYQADTSFDYQQPATGFDYTVPNDKGTVILDPAGVLATGSITMQENPSNGDVVRVSTSQAITALTVAANVGQSIKNAPTTLAAGGKFAYVYRAANSTWYVYP